MQVGRPLSLGLVILVLSGCAAKYTQVPARLDLEPYGRIAIVTLSDDPSRSGLARIATEQFTEQVLRNQGGEVFELGPRDSALIQLASRGDISALADSLARSHDVPAVFVGQLSVSGTKARGRLSSPTDLAVKAEVQAQLSMKLISARTGGTMWRSSAETKSTVGQVSMAGGLPSVVARSTDDAYGEVVQELVNQVSRDLRPTWVRQ